MQTIGIQEMAGLRIGQVEDAKAGTGCTVLLCPEGMRAGLDVRGGGPSSRESQLLNPLMAAEVLHGIVLAGGSSFGLGAADGVMRFLEEKGVGLDVGITKVPLVAQSDIFDLTVGDSHLRPDSAMGYEAARLAWEAPYYKDGNFGAGCGASVGKWCGMEYAMKTGVGSYVMRLGSLEVGALVVLNALGDVFDWKNARQVAGLLGEDKKSLRDSSQVMKEASHIADNKFVNNTTIGVVFTNAYFEKAALCKIAGMAQDGMARAISPVHTSADGDSLYAVSLGDTRADRDLVGTLAAEAVSEAILQAVSAAESAYGLPAARDLGFLP